MYKLKECLCFDDVLLVPEHSEVLSRNDVILEQTFAGVNHTFSLKIPLVGAPMDTVMGINMAVALHNLGGIGIMDRFCSIQEQTDKIKVIYKLGAECGAALPATRDLMERFYSFWEVGVRIFCIDIAHGDHVLMERAISQVRDSNRPAYIIAGNVATKNAASRLVKVGADCIRTSVGSGSACTTRLATGFGIPTLQAVIDIKECLTCYSNTAIMADGGIKNSGDAVKSLVAGAKLIMCGSLLAGTDESPGDIIDQNGIKVKLFRGMSSRDAHQKLHSDKKVAPEGVSHFIPYKGSVIDVVNDFIGGIKSGASYAGVKDIKDMYGCAEFVKVSSAGHRESMPHIKF